ncbi:MAG: hypothetical protein LBR68_03890 [Lachnoclostridium sp.]|jgi:hypothetical protein|nr:hypothetical protein [Lachnoclostridium sp.]
MNLVEKLVKIDKKDYEQIEVKKIKSKMIARRLKVSEDSEDAEITIKAIDGDLFAELTATSVDKKGNVIIGKAFSANAKIVAVGLVEPNLKDKELLNHLGAATPEAAAKKIFNGEINKIAAEISELSGMSNDEDEIEEIKN